MEIESVIWGRICILRLLSLKHNGKLKMEISAFKLVHLLHLVRYMVSVMFTHAFQSGADGEDAAFYTG